tara:strand:- start:549 stop:1067 length:519 start_codon:yes stop_codon:yes gene_type:complete
MASELRVDRIIPVNGVPTNGGGSILQIMPVYGLTTPLVTTNTSYSSMGLSGTITPLRTDSKIYISINVVFCGDIDNDTQGYVSAGFNVRRAIGGGGPTDIFTMGGSTEVLDLGGHSRFKTTNWNFIDSPNTTSQVTYDMEYKMANSAGRSIFVGRSSLPNNGGQMILMEVSG